MYPGMYKIQARQRLTSHTDTELEPPMLLADKHDLQQRLKVKILQIEEKELNHYTNNANTLGTQVHNP